ncbi:Malate dehydrogenase [archaeon HR06]|nr:Malate dehydrogenase [archaeon HR06]
MDDINLIDIVEGLPQGEALDLSHMASKLGSDVKVRGSNDFSSMKDSNLVIITAGLARKPGMTRMDLLNKNFEIVKGICEKVKDYTPKAKILMVTNPLDVMTYVALKVTGFDKSKVFGMGGLLDSSRFAQFISQHLGISRKSIQALVIGEHGENMLPLIRYSSIGGIPLTFFLKEEERRKIMELTVKVAAEVIALKGATVHAPAFAVAKMVEAVVKDTKEVLPLSTYLEGEYGVKGICIGVPAILGKEGVERIIELELNSEERSIFNRVVETIRRAIREIGYEDPLH